jgi:hypothetical protein
LFSAARSVAEKVAIHGQFSAGKSD